MPKKIINENDLFCYWEDDYENNIFKLYDKKETLFTYDNKKVNDFDCFIYIIKNENISKKFKSKWRAFINISKISCEIFPIFINETNIIYHELMIFDLDDDIEKSKKSLIEQLKYSFNMVKDINIHYTRKNKINLLTKNKN